jgi:geranylgeranyl pyrophosphate synthase
LGKPIAADLRQGLITLPVLYYLQAYPGDDRVHKVMTNHLSERNINALAADIKSSDAPKRAMRQAELRVSEAHRLLAQYPDSAYRQAMEEIASFAVNRRY